MVLRIHPRILGYLMAALVSIALALQAQGQAAPYTQCNSRCESTSSTYFCETGYQTCYIGYSSYQGPDFANDVSISQYMCCRDPDLAPVWVDTCGPTSDPSCSHGDPCAGCPCQCFSWGCDWGCSYSPILIDLDGKGYQLTGLNDPVHFDLNADGAPEITGWTARNTNQGFLWLDRNGNGAVDSGAELFGNYTPLAAGGTALNGFRALAEFDQPEYGGNADGVIDSRDAVFQRLRVWIDRNHNGISEPAEILTLAQAGVARIELKYESNGREDKFGNRFRFKGKAWISAPNGTEHPVRIYDVFFVTQH